MMFRRQDDIPLTVVVVGVEIDIRKSKDDIPH